METKVTYCKKTDCDVMSCSRNPKNVEEFGVPMQFAHLEDNPKYCKKGNWYGYQVKEGNKDDQD